MHSSICPISFSSCPPFLFLIFSFVTPTLIELPPALQTKSEKKRDNAVKKRQGDKKKSEIEQYKNLDIGGGSESQRERKKVEQVIVQRSQQLRQLY